MVKEECLATSTTTTTTPTQSVCWTSTSEKNFGGTNKVMMCDDMDQVATQDKQCGEDGGWSVSRDVCKDICERTAYCTGFEYVHSSDNDGGNDKCYFTDGTDSEKVDCAGSEAWELDDSCVLTTTTYHECWEFGSGFQHSTLDEFVAADNAYDSDSTWMACEHYEPYDKDLCDEDDKSWKLDRDTCKEKCDDIMGCQSFSYSQKDSKCWLSKLRAEEADDTESFGYEFWTTECTTTTFCELCEVECPHAEILDLRYVAWSNLGGQGPNRTVVRPNGTELAVPQTIVYYNVFNASEPEEVVYLVVSNVTEYDAVGDVMSNGVSRESDREFKERREQDKLSYHLPMEGAYGSINLLPGHSVTLKFEFMDHEMKPMIPDKVVALTFLDIDQPTRGADGAEQVNVCTGANSFGFPRETKLEHSWAFLDEEQLLVCHEFDSRTLGDREDNPWNPAHKRKDGGQGLEDSQKEKMFTAAFWHTSSFNATFTVDAEVIPNTVDTRKGRNLLFAGHETSFCGEEQSCYVIMDKCAADAVNSPDADFKQSCLDRPRCEDRETEDEYNERAEAIRESKKSNSVSAKTQVASKR